MDSIYANFNAQSWARDRAPMMTHQNHKLEAHLTISIFRLVLIKREPGKSIFLGIILFNKIFFYTTLLSDIENLLFDIIIILYNDTTLTAHNESFDLFKENQYFCSVFPFALNYFFFLPRQKEFDGI